ncbi:hypothetical protein EGD11_06240 [Salmonella enterica]|nr:hypothetical protein [Salmonella enterica]ECD0241420.1 hypothetical protein [Salmonella enterica subsp. enterica]
MRSYLKDGHKLYRSTLAFYLHAPDIDALFRQQRQLHSLLLNARLVPVQEQHEVAPLSHWLRRI